MASYHEYVLEENRLMCEGFESSDAYFPSSFKNMRTPPDTLGLCIFQCKVFSTEIIATVGEYYVLYDFFHFLLFSVKIMASRSYKSSLDFFLLSVWLFHEQSLSEEIRIKFEESK